MNVRLLAPAQAELDEAMSWYSAQAPGLGDGFLVEVLRSIQLIQRHPEGWHPLTPCFNVNAPKPTPAFDRGNRTYCVSDERMRAFGQLTVAQRLQWVEQCSQFVRLAQEAQAQRAPQPR